MSLQLPYELLEAILEQVDMQTLLLAQRVNRLWARLIKRSSKLQQILFFQPAPPDTPRQQNSLLASKFPYWFPADNDKSCSIAFGAGDMQDFLENSQPYLRRKASWRRMLVQQPPIMTLAYLERNLTPANAVVLHRRETPLQAFRGPRMNMLYDLVVQTAHTVQQYFYFRVCWSWYETYAFREQSLRSDPDPTHIEDSNGVEPLKNALESADVVLDMWSTHRLPGALLSEWAKDTWTWDLVEGLQAPMGDLKVRQVLDMRELKDAKFWYSLNPREVADSNALVTFMPTPFMPTPFMPTPFMPTPYMYLAPPHW